jgi:hypothetical protein
MEFSQIFFFQLNNFVPCSRTIFILISSKSNSKLIFGSKGQFTERMPEFAMQFARMKKEKGFKTWMVCRKDRNEVDISTRQHRYLPNISESPAVTNIYGNKIAIIIWTDEPEGIIIENGAAAQAYKSYFDFMWGRGKKFG